MFVSNMRAQKLRLSKSKEINHNEQIQTSGSVYTDILGVDVYSIGSWLAYDEGVAICRYLHTNRSSTALLWQVDYICGRYIHPRICPSFQ